MKIKVTNWKKIDEEWYQQVKTFDKFDDFVKYMEGFNAPKKFEVVFIKEEQK